MLSPKQVETLQKNWGVISECLSCKSEVRVYDPLSTWECYIHAMNPDNPDEVVCIINGETVEVSIWSLKEIAALFNSHGDSIRVDTSYRPRLAKEVYKSLRKDKYDGQ